MKLSCGFLLSLVLLVSQPVSAASTWFLASELDCEAIADKTFASDREYAYDLAEYFQCLGFIAALVQSDALPNSCIPEDVELDELRGHFDQGLAADAELADKPAQEAMQVIFSRHYPCQQTETTPDGY